MAEITESMVEMTAFTAKGEPLARKPLDQLYFLTLDDEPIPNPPRVVEPGKLLSRLPDIPFAIALKLSVTDFGEVFLYADNRGEGYSRADFPLNLNLAFADSRFYRVRSSIELWRKQGFSFSPEIFQRLEKAERYLNRGREAEDSKERARYCDLSLNESLYAGEEAVFSKASQIIARKSPRPDYLFGCNFFGHPQQGEEYDRLFKNLFDFATVPFYWRYFEPKLGEKNFASVDTSVNWLLSQDITPKGHPLVWFHEIGFPEEIREKSFAEITDLVARRVREITAYYRGKINYYDVINEANGLAWANELQFSLEQFIELTRIAAVESRRGNPEVFRIVNNCCLWAENVAYHQPPQHSPFEYLRSILDAGIEFEAIGLQLYYPDRDFFEIDRLLDRFSRLGKTIHITELGVSSSTEIDETSYLKEPAGRWRKPWSEEVQAAWIEQFYTLCYSKSYIEAISWWDLTDNGNFWPNGGLVRKDMTPKLGYLKLQELIHEWRGIG
ncbi:endo-1,4-beta-xylanase [Pannus brasiliensis CCIBt3594]|uniref:endo-1,4-beta-xylanase n=1 Tax=Pannus brasiliensis CCIBt3594 TaxID=1427578 RepID=A0AAW9QUC0_9CHRO